ncbi:MAG TPA: RNA 2',3'-cyclic phosphodiesterase, partial [Candidatus Sulfotelmatobacter sp.]|nr:RNA 2',3'-cyclic phosphodiesterase [Candidatus Sulfotelmatobacter sp.]
MRLFVALDIDAEIRERLARFADGLRQFAPDARWVKEESLHITLKFIGEWPEPEVDRIKGELAGVAGQAAVIQFKGYGFFPSTKSARVFWVGLEAGPELVALAAAVEEKLQVLGIAKEERKFSPHLTLARSPGGSG